MGYTPPPDWIEFDFIRDMKPSRKWNPICPFCSKPVGIIGNWAAVLFGTKIHNCDHSIADTWLEQQIVWKKIATSGQRIQANTISGSIRKLNNSNYIKGVKNRYGSVKCIARFSDNTTCGQNSVNGNNYCINHNR